MHRLHYLSISCFLIISANLAHAQGGWIKLASDLGGGGCNFSTAGLIQVYQFHQSSPATTLSRYKIDDSNANSVVWLADNYGVYFPLGEANTGVTVAYGFCVVSPFLIGSSTYLYNSLSGGTTCDGWLEVVPDPKATSDTVESIDCSVPTPIKYVAGSSVATLGVLDCTPGCGQVPVLDTSWGKIKSLYK